VVSFIDAVNRGDVAALAALMTEDHTLHVLDEAPLIGKSANIEAWRGYVSSFPQYVIYPHEIAAEGPRVAVVGHTTGSHLGLSDEEEQELTIIWSALVDDGRLRLWQIVEDTPEHRSERGPSN